MIQVKDKFYIKRKENIFNVIIITAAGVGLNCAMMELTCVTCYLMHRPLIPAHSLRVNPQHTVTVAAAEREEAKWQLD